MAVSSIQIPSNIKDIKIVHTQVEPSGTLAANSGASASLTPTAPSGYNLLTHFAVWNRGIPGLLVSFDGASSLPTSATVNVYQYNTKGSATTGRGVIHLLSAYYR